MAHSRGLDEHLEGGGEKRQKTSSGLFSNDFSTELLAIYRRDTEQLAEHYPFAAKYLEVHPCRKGETPEEKEPVRSWKEAAQDGFERLLGALPERRRVPSWEEHTEYVLEQLLENSPRH